MGGAWLFGALAECNAVVETAQPSAGEGWGFGMSASHAFDWYHASSSAGTRGRSLAKPAGSFILSSAATFEETIGAAAACSDVLAVLASLKRVLVSILKPT
jgi:hypothetical protein